MEALLTTRQLAELWHQTPRWVLRMHREHGLPAYRLGGALRFRASEAEDWLQLRQERAVPLPTIGAGGQRGPWLLAAPSEDSAWSVT